MSKKRGSYHCWHLLNLEREVFYVRKKQYSNIQFEDGKTKIDVKLEDETVWLSQQQVEELFSTSRTNIVEHINNIYIEDELDKNSICQNSWQVWKERNRKDERKIKYYNLDMIISLEYRIKDKI